MKRKLVLFAVLALLCLGMWAQHYTDYQVFIWDNDKNATFVNPDDLKRTGYETNIIKAFERLGFSQEGKNLKVATSLPTAEELTRYAAVFIICGNTPISTEIFTSGDISTLDEYLYKYGGAVYMEGNNVQHFLNEKFRGFSEIFFNNALVDTGSEYTGYDTIVTDTASSFTHGYTIVYPAGSDPDVGTDVFKYDRELPEPYYYSVLVYDEKQKLYKSAASAYTPPEGTKERYIKTDDKAEPKMFKTFFSAIDMGAYAAPHRKYEQLPDSIQNQLLRASYVSDIMKWFGLARTVVVDRTGKGNESVRKSLEGLGVEYDYIQLDPAKPISFSLRPYNTVVWIGGPVPAKDGPILTRDIDSLMVYMDYGGNLFMFGENIAEAIGVRGANEPAGENPFLVKYLGVDYLDATFSPDKDYTSAGTGSYYELHEASRYVSLADTYDPDWVRSMYLAGQNYSEPVFYFKSSTKEKAPAVAGVYNTGSTFETVFMTYMLETADPVCLDTVMAVTLVDYFAYDTIYNPHDNTGSTAIKAIALTYDKTERGIWFYVDIQKPDNGSLTLVSANETVEEPVYEGNSKYVLYTETTSGNFVVRYTTAEGVSFEKSVKIEEVVKKDYAYTSGSVLNIELLNPNSSTVKLYDITGKHITDIPVMGSSYVWNGFADMPSGVYFVKILSNVNSTTSKVLRY